MRIPITMNITINVERTFWNPRGKEEFSETSSHTLRARALGRACRAGEPTRSRWENKIFYLKRHGTLTNEDDLLRWSALVCTLRCIGQRYLLQVRSLTPLSPARCTDSGTLPRSLRGTLCIFDDTLEQTEASDRFSTDDGRCALALLELQESRSRSRSLGRQVEVLETSRTAVPWKC